MRLRHGVGVGGVGPAPQCRDASDHAEFGTCEPQLAKGGNAMRWMPAYVALGSNLDEPRKQVERGFERLAQLSHTKLIARSALYQSKPLGPQQQADFINAVAGLLTTLSAQQLLIELKQLETDLGRAQPIVRWGPRRIDFDLLVFADARIDETDLVIPHPGIPERNFVLYPLCDIAPELVIPGMGVARDLAQRVSSAGLHVLP
jgi:2-amino-4-hydroxy-6-hydroxymethyldihydropteridine diphosphokinase